MMLPSWSAMSRAQADERVAEEAAEVVGIDNSNEMVVAAQAKGVFAELRDSTEIDFVNTPEHFEQLVEQVRNAQKGTQYYVPLGS